MSPLDAARQLLDGVEPYREANRFSGERGPTYWYCRGRAPMADGHMPGCPWLARPKLVAALEAAERVAAKEPIYGETWRSERCVYCDGPPGGHEEDCLWHRLQGALRGGPDVE